MKILTILGARPQFIKASILSRGLSQEENINEKIVHTGQHYDINMSDIFFQEMQIPRPAYHLQISSKTHGDMTGKMLIEIEKIVQTERPDLLLVYGDTNSTLAGALAASKLHIPVAHVESGLRSFNKKMPEEINRVLTDHIADYLFAPTATSVQNLIREGIHEQKICQTGDIMYDGMLYYGELAEKQSTIVNSLGLAYEPFILASIHRQENTNNSVRLNTIFDQLNSISKKTKIVLPLHPRTKTYVNRDYSSSSFKIIPPVGYFDMIALQKKCGLIITDSGGLQKEAFFNSKFCLTLRDETEWTELTENKLNFLVNPLESLQDLVESVLRMEFPQKKFDFYGDGFAASKIIMSLRR